MCVRCWFRVGLSAWVLIGFVASSALNGYAQTEAATIRGSVTDPSGALVSNAAIRLVDIDRGTRSEVQTGNSGFYNFAGVAPGRYRMEVEKSGFKLIHLTGIAVNVQDNLEENFKFDVGAVSESITVEANALNVNTTDATVSTVVDRQFAENLPLNGRSFQSLIQLTPGVVVATSSLGDGGQFNVNGQRANANYWMVDGVSANIGIAPYVTAGNGLAGALGSFSALGGTNSLVSVDALQEFRIQTSTYAPEFGRTPGGQISIVTRSGTNQFHGTAFDYVRNDLFDASDWFADSAGLPKPRERQNDFGGTVSGPILRSRTFFFFSYEGLRLRLPQTALSTVPDIRARQNAQPPLQPYLNAYPLPNGPEVLDSNGNSTGAAAFNASYSNPATLNAYSLRIDHRVKNKLTLFGRYDYSPSQLAQRIAGLALSLVDSSNITTQTTTIGTDWLISPVIGNDLRFNYSKTDGSFTWNLDNFGGAVPLLSPPFPSPYTRKNAVFFFTINSLTGGQYAEGRASRNLQRQFNVVDNLSWQKGTHSLKVGVDYRRLSPLFSPDGYVQEVFFNDVPSAQIGNVNAGGSVLSNLGANFFFHNLGAFAQDTWRVVPRLTVTYGFRWDVDFVPSTSNGPNILAVTGYNLNDSSNLALAGVGTSPFKTRYWNLAPRLGVAYELHQNDDWGTVFRGGLGLFYDMANGEYGNLVSYGGYPFGAVNSFSSGSFPLSPAVATPPPISAASLSSNTLTAFDPNLRLPYTVEWNVALEQGLGKQQTISASYIGSAGRRLIQSAFVNAPNPNIGSAYLVGNTATSDYDALQLQFKRKLSRGLQALASYTWSHSIDTASGGSLSGSFGNTLIPGLRDSKTNRGSSDFDIRHAFSAAITYDVPFPRINHFTMAVLRDWSLQSVVQAWSAPPDNLYDSSAPLVPQPFVAFARPDAVSGQPLYLYGAQYPGGKAFNPAAFVSPPVGATTGLALREGDLGRNALRGFGATQWDFAVHRDFPIHEALRLQFRAEMFNIVNHPNFGPPQGIIGFGSFGQATQTLGQSLGVNTGNGGFSPLYQIGGPRSVQFALKLMF